MRRAQKKLETGSSVQRAKRSLKKKPQFQKARDQLRFSISKRPSGRGGIVLSAGGRPENLIL